MSMIDCSHKKRFQEKIIHRQVRRRLTGAEITTEGTALRPGLTWEQVGQMERRNGCSACVLHAGKTRNEVIIRRLVQIVLKKKHEKYRVPNTYQ